MNVILGIDPGSVKTGWCLMDAAAEVHDYGLFAYSPKKYQAEERLVMLFCDLLALVEDRRPDVIGCEEPMAVFWHRNKTTERRIITAFAAPFYVAALKGIPFRSVTPKEVRLSGFHKKALVDTALFLGIEVIPKSRADIADAVGAAAHLVPYSFLEWKAQRWKKHYG
jgi:Holliday junction resolvasome RuvABC endonuclease subunit